MPWHLSTLNGKKQHYEFYFCGLFTFVVQIIKKKCACVYMMVSAGSFVVNCSLASEEIGRIFDSPEPFQARIEQNCGYTVGQKMISVSVKSELQIKLA